MTGQCTREEIEQMTRDRFGVRDSSAYRAQRRRLRRGETKRVLRFFGLSLVAGGVLLLIARAW